MLVDHDISCKTVAKKEEELMRQQELLGHLIPLRIINLSHKAVSLGLELVLNTFYRLLLIDSVSLEVSSIRVVPL